MTFSKNEKRVIEEIFKRAYADKETVPVGDRWTSDVMRRIRHLAPVASGKSFFLGLEQIIWRLAPATCLLIVVLATILLKTGVMPDENIFQVLMNGEDDLTISQLVGV